jgi:hypothetical protein
MGWEAVVLVVVVQRRLRRQACAHRGRRPGSTRPFQCVWKHPLGRRAFTCHPAKPSRNSTGDSVLHLGGSGGQHIASLPPAYLRQRPPRAVLCARPPRYPVHSPWAWAHAPAISRTPPCVCTSAASGQSTAGSSDIYVPSATIALCFSPHSLLLVDSSAVSYGCWIVHCSHSWFLCTCTSNAQVNK